MLLVLISSFPPPPEIVLVGVLVFKVLTKRGFMIKLLRDKGLVKGGGSLRKEVSKLFTFFDW